MDRIYKRRTTLLNSYFLLKKWRNFGFPFNPAINFVLSRITNDNLSYFILSKLVKLLKHLLINSYKRDIKSIVRNIFNLVIKWEDGRYDSFKNFPHCIQEGEMWYGINGKCRNLFVRQKVYESDPELYGMTLLRKHSELYEVH